MNLFLIPLVVTIVALGLLAAMAVVSVCLQLNDRLKPAGKSLLRSSCRALLTGIVVAWIGMPVAMALGGVLGEPAGILFLWACGPAGALAELLWPRRAAR